MTIHDEDVHTAPVWGAPPPPPAEVNATGGPGGGGPAGPDKKKMSPMAKTLTAVGVAAVVAVGGTVAVTAANSSSTGSAQNGTAGQGGPGGAGFGGANGGGFGRQADSAVGALSNALHGQFVISGSSGTTTTEQIQTGTVTAVSATSLSVKSTDGFTGTYVVGSVDVSSATAGTSVTVLATVKGSTLNLVSVRAGSATTANQNGAPAGGAAPQGNGNAAPTA